MRFHIVTEVKLQDTYSWVTSSSRRFSMSSVRCTESLSLVGVSSRPLPVWSQRPKRKVVSTFVETYCRFRVCNFGYKSHGWGSDVLSHWAPSPCEGRNLESKGQPFEHCHWTEVLTNTVDLVLPLSRSLGSVVWVVSRSLSQGGVLLFKTF